MAQRNVREETSSDFVESFSTIGMGSASPDWRDTKTASQRLDHLCLSNHLSDVTLLFSKEPSVKLPVHKFILSMRSRVFEAMFYGKCGFTGSTVTIDDVGSETMRLLVRFMYTDKADITGKNVLKCLEGAKLYAITGLAANCSAFLEKNVYAGNVCIIHEQAIYYKMKELQTKCFEFMLENASEVFKSNSFLKISKSTLVNLLKSDDLAEDEEIVFAAALNWTEAQCSSNKMHVTPDNKRKCLGEALNEIRFPIMSIENFAKLVTPAGILTSEEQIMLYQYFASNGTSPLNKFTARERCGKVVTIDTQMFCGKRGYFGRLSPGYVLNIQLDSMHAQWGNIQLDSMHAQWGNDGSDAVKLKAVTCTFAAKVKRVCSDYDRWDGQDFKVQGDKIILHPPLLISNRTTVVFETTTNTQQFFHRNAHEGESYNVDCSTNVSGKTINITQIPDGLTSISFAK